MWHIYRSCQPEDVENQLCFQILGFDVMIDQDLKPYLIEVNHAPSLATDSAFDLTVKKKLVADTIRLLNLSLKRKWNYINNSKEQFQKRILTGKMQKLTIEEKQIKRQSIDEQRNEIEKKLMGGYRRIFPCEDVVKKEKYKKMLDISKELYDYLDKGKRGINLRMLREQEQQNKDKKPAWRSTGVSNMPNWDKPSKYQQNSNIKAKIYTGLQGTDKKKQKAPE